MIDQDEDWQERGGREKQRERARETEEGRRLGPEEWGQRVLKGLRRQECIGAFSVHS